MALKKLEKMNLEELKQLRDWYSSRIKYVLFLINEQENALRESQK